MKERPILFNAEMVKALLEGRKSQTRRIVKPQQLKEFNAAILLGECSNFLDDVKQPGDDEYLAGLCPKGAPGDELWVRETHWRYLKASTPMEMTRVIYEADGTPTLDSDHDLGLMRKYPSIHMPRWASRTQLKITNIRVERVQDISEEDARAEGIDSSDSEFGNLCQNIIDSGYSHNVERNSAEIACFKKLWDSINEHRGYGWGKNLLNWVIEFEVL